MKFIEKIKDWFDEFYCYHVQPIAHISKEDWFFIVIQAIGMTIVFLWLVIVIYQAENCSI